MKQDDGVTYSEAGVDIDKANQLVQGIKDMVKETHTPGVIGDLGGFGGLFAPDLKDYERPVMVAGTDGVGTKLKIAQKMNEHETIGIDLVAMCVNDILAQGAKPLFFLDYLACGELNLTVNKNIVKGIVEGCKQAGTALLGGETAEMPGFYPRGEYELAGFAVGMVDKNSIITGKDIENNNILLGIPAAGVHSNGFSLVRYIINNSEDLSLEKEVTVLNDKLGKELLTPTRIYVKLVLPLLQKFNIKGIAHITGGGLPENIARILPEGLQAQIDTESWPHLPVFDFIQKKGQVETEEMFKTFNMGIGLVIAVSKNEKEPIMDFFEENNEEIYQIGKVIKGEKNVELKF